MIATIRRLWCDLAHGPEQLQFQRRGPDPGIPGYVCRECGGWRESSIYVNPALDRCRVDRAKECEGAR